MTGTTRPTTRHLAGNLITRVAGPEETGNAFALHECISAPGAGAPPNRHPEDEAFLILEGTIECVVEGVTNRHGAGAFVKIPKNAVHTFSNIGDTPARLLVFNWPGHDHVVFFGESGEPVPTGTETFPPVTPPDPEEMLSLGKRCNMEFFPPSDA